MDETLPDGYRIEAAAVSASRRAAVVAAAAIAESGFRGAQDPEQMAINAAAVARLLDSLPAY